MRRKLLLFALVLIAVGAFSACAANGYYVVRSAPPAPLSYGAVGVAPGPGHVWVDGFWDWRGGRWFWVRGYWTRPPRAHAVWVAPSWRPYGRGYRYYRGHWR